MDAACSQCSPCWQAQHSVRTRPSFSWLRADAVIRWSRGWPPPDTRTRHTIQISESVMSRPSLSHLLQQHLQSRLDDLQVPAVLACHILQSCLQHHLLKVLKIISMNKYWVSNIKLFSMAQCLLTISNSSNRFSYLEKLEHIPGIEHFSDGVVSLLYHHWSY